MTPTIAYIQRKFNEFNELCFEAKLKPVSVKLSNARTFFGKVEYKRRMSLFGRWRNEDFVLRISTKMDRSEEDIEDTILHEMIHYWILSNQMEDSSAHGEIFIKKMEEINRKYNRHLSVSYRSTKADHDRDTEFRRHYICLSRFRDGRRGLTVAAETRLFRLWDEMPRAFDLEEIKWVATTDPYFNRFPRALKPKIYVVDEAELEAHLEYARELERKNGIISVKE